MAAVALPAALVAGAGPASGLLAHRVAAPTVLTMRLAATSQPASPRAAEVSGVGQALEVASPQAPVVAVAADPRGAGSWTVTSTGFVRARDGARSYGSLAGRWLGTTIVGIAATPDGRGYWLAGANGSVFPFGNATWRGSLRHRRAPAPVSAIAAAPHGEGYLLVSADGAVHAFGDATWRGSLRTRGLASPITAAAFDPAGSGYWLVDASGRVWAFGTARSHGSLRARHLGGAVTSLESTPSGRGYWLSTADGSVYGFGDAGTGAGGPAGAAERALLAEVRGLHLPLPAPPSHPTSPQRVAPTTPAEPATTPSTAANTGSSTVAVAPPSTAAVPTSGPGRYLGMFTVTCYDNYGTTASGATTSLATVAVDPAVIPLGTTIDIAGVGVRVAQDTGGAIIGDRLDIWEPSLSACIDWGVENEGVWLAG